MKDGKLTLEDLNEELYRKLAAPFPEEAIQRANTKQFKGYDTVGLGYQYVINRLNEVLGIGHWLIIEDMQCERIEGQKNAWEATCTITMQIGNWNNNEFEVLAQRTSYGGHQSKFKTDALKGAHTNGLKKVAAEFGVGREAYEGSLDDDYIMGVEGIGYDNNNHAEAGPELAKHNVSALSAEGNEEIEDPFSDSSMATEEQKKAIEKWSGKIGKKSEEIYSHYNCSADNLTFMQAAKIIKDLVNEYKKTK